MVLFLLLSLVQPRQSRTSFIRIVNRACSLSTCKREGAERGNTGKKPHQIGPESRIQTHQTEQPLLLLALHIKVQKGDSSY
jgi:hypothetical protein